MRLFKRGFPITIMLFCLGLLSVRAAIGQVIPKPEDVLGFTVGADYKLATYTQAIEYFKRLAASSARIKLFDVGKTSEGRVMTYAAISSEQNMASLEKYKDIAKRISQARISAEEAQKLAAEGKAIVYVDGGLHAGECAPAQHNIQLAYDLVSGNDPMTMRILEDCILVLVFANPDGMEMLAGWYLPNVGTPFETSSMPWLYHKYAGHDNNRDSYIANLVETQHLTKIVHKDWNPVVLYNHHQTAPFPARIWIPPNSEPTNPNVHPLLVRWQNLIGSAMGAAFDEAGQEGAISRIVFDTWYPGYVSQVVDSHNIISIMTETALFRYATPRFYTVRDFPAEYQDLTMSAFYPSPWRGGWWRLKDAVDYCLTASKAVLAVSSKYRQELLLDKFRMGRDTIEKFKKEPPYAWIIPEQQADPPSMALLLNRMILLGIDVYRAGQTFSVDGLSFPAGTYILPVSQANGLFLKNVFEEQRYPDLRKYPDLWQGLVRSRKFEGAPFEAYDLMGWTLPYQFGLKAHVAQSPVEAKMDPVNEVAPPRGQVTGGGGSYFFSHETNAGFTATNRILKAGGRVLWAKKAFNAGGKDYPEGTVIVPAAGVGSATMETLARELSLQVSAGQMPGVETYELKKPRVGIYQSWMSSADEGWTRFIMELYEIPYTILHDADIRAGELNSKLDVLIMSDYGSAQSVVDGYAKGTMPPNYVGGITTNGLRNLKLFVESGGTMIFVNGICEMAAESFGAPVRNVLKDVKSEQFNCAGSILRLEFDTAHPLAYGMPKEAGVVFSDSCAFDITPTFGSKAEPRSAAKYAQDNLLMSGWIHGEGLIKQKSALIDVPSGKGKIILIGFPVQFRGQPYSNFKILFNAIHYGAMK